MATITYQGNKQISPGNLEETHDSVEYADHSSRLVFRAGEPQFIHARLGAVLISGMPANDKIPVGSPRKGQPIFKLELSADEHALLTGQQGGSGAPRMEWGPEGDYRAAYDNLMAKWPKHVVVAELVSEPEPEKTKASR